MVLFLSSWASPEAETFLLFLSLLSAILQVKSHEEERGTIIQSENKEKKQRITIRHHPAGNISRLFERQSRLHCLIIVQVILELENG